jgi:hypothetical protein
MKKQSFYFASKILLAAISLTFAITSCKKKTPDVVLPPIGGYNNSNEVAAANLKAHWPFDGTLNERISSTAPSTSLRNSFVTGVKGQAVKLDSGYILYPTIAALNTNLGSITVSTWINTENQGAGTRPTGVFALTLGTSAQTDWNSGPVNMYLENGRPKTYNDTLVLHSAIATYKTGARLGGDNINDFGARETDFKTVLGANKWVHYVLRWDASGSFIDIFANGVLVSNKNFRYRSTGPAPGVPLGDIVLPAGTQTQVLLGAFPNSTTGFANSPIQGFQGLFRGSMDEVRFYNKALSADEITSLYQLELAGR